MTWMVEYLNQTVVEEAEALPIDMQARLQRIIELVQLFGLERVHEPHVKHLGLPLGNTRVRQERNCVGAVCHGDG